MQEARENLIAQESALNERIARLAKLAAEVDRPSRDSSVKGGYPPVGEVGLADVK